ncbi:MAG: ATP-grasp family protein, partial [Hydrogenovibrio crunogenus]|nr:ATP-grasp family protein [Hydrogenovibrio crunogenus]
MIKNASSLKIGVVGIPGKWSTEVLADAIEAKTGFRMVIDIEKVVAYLDEPSVRYKGTCLCELDGIIIKKISQTYSPAVIDRLEILRFVEKCGVKIFSKPQEIIRLVDRMSCTVSLAKANIPMPPTIITEDIEAAYEGVLSFGKAILKPLFSTKARGMEVLNSASSAKTLKAQLNQYY